jgi:hypothetical protein
MLRVQRIFPDHRVDESTFYGNTSVFMRVLCGRLLFGFLRLSPEIILEPTVPVRRHYLCRA